MIVAPYVFIRNYNHSLLLHFFYLYIATTLAVAPVASKIVTKSSASCLVKPFAARVGTLSITFFASAGR